MSRNDSENNSSNSNDHARQMGEIVRSAFSSGDLSRLKDLGPVAGAAAKDFSGMIAQAGDKLAQGGGQPQPHEEGARPPHPYKTMRSQGHQPRQPWQGSAVPAKRNSAGIPPGVFRIIFGVMGIVVFGLGALVAAGLGLLLSAAGHLLPLAAGLGAMVLPSGLLTASGFKKNKVTTRAREYEALLQKKNVMSFEDLAAETGRTPKQIKRDIRAARRRGLLKDVRTDADENTLMLGEETYQLYLESEKTQREKEAEEEERQRRLQNPETSALEQFRSEGIETIRKIRNANEAIPGEEISRKLEKLEGICARIFSYVEERPEKLPDTRKFMSYYLPTTLKLVEKYREYEELSYQPANVVKAKEEIESTLDTVNTAFTTLLESLYAHDTLDVSADIEVMKQMMEQEGLTGRDFEINSKPKPES